MRKYVRIIVKQDNKYLVLYQKELGRYLFVGGKVEVGEDWAEAAVREFREELGCELREAELVTEQVQILNGGVQWTGRYYFAYQIWGIPRIMEPQKHEDLHLVSLAEIIESDKMHKVTKDVAGLLEGLPETEMLP